MKRVLYGVAAAAIGAVAAFSSGAMAGDPPSCQTVTTSKGETLQVYQYGGNAAGTLDATGCQVGVYYDSAHTGNVSGADISNATWYGVYVDKGASVDVTDSTITNIGDQPTFTGSQHGLGIYYRDGATGTVSGNTVSDYQKNGITVTGDGTSVTVTNNTVDGNGAIPYIAQNGIEFGFGASGIARGNSIQGMWYTGATWTSTGLLLFDVNANAVKTSNNMLRNNQTEYALIESHACAKMHGGVYYDYGLCS